MKQVKKRVVCLALGIILVLFSFSGCAKQEKGAWIQTSTTGDRIDVAKDSEIYQELEKIMPEGASELYCDGYNVTSGTKAVPKYYIGFAIEDVDDFSFKIKDNEQPSQRNREVWNESVEFVKAFHKEILEKYLPQDTVCISIITRGTDMSPVLRVDYNKTVDNTWSWRVNLVGDEHSETILEKSDEWKKLVNDKFLTQHYAYGESPEYVKQ